MEVSICLTCTLHRRRGAATTRCTGATVMELGQGITPVEYLRTRPCWATWSEITPRCPHRTRRTLIGASISQALSPRRITRPGLRKGKAQTVPGSRSARRVAHPLAQGPTVAAFPTAALRPVAPVIWSSRLRIHPMLCSRGSFTGASIRTVRTSHHHLRRPVHHNLLHQACRTVPLSPMRRSASADRTRRRVALEEDTQALAFAGIARVAALAQIVAPASCVRILAT